MSSSHNRKKYLVTTLTQIEVQLSQWIKDFTEGQQTGIPVPCGECQACCKNLNAQLYTHELKLDYKKKFSRNERKYHLKHKPNGDCYYLATAGCTIHHRVPQVCRVFDCRIMGYFKILDPQHDGINAASKRWIFVIDRPDIHQFCKKHFEVAVNLLPVRSGDPVDIAAKNAILAAYHKFFGEAQ